MRIYGVNGGTGELVSDEPVKETAARYYFPGGTPIATAGHVGFTSTDQRYIEKERVDQTKYGGGHYWTTAAAALDQFVANLTRLVAREEADLAKYRQALITATAARAALDVPAQEVG